MPEQLQAIVNDYSKKIEEKTPALIEEYQTEIQGNQEGIAGLSAVANQKHVSFKQSPTKGSENYVQRIRQQKIKTV